MSWLERAALVALASTVAGCTVDALTSAGRPCSASSPCGPDAVCDPGRGVCVAFSLDRGAPAGDRRREAPVGLEAGEDRGGGDRAWADLPRPATDAGCPAGLARCGSSCVDLSTSAGHCGACNAPCTAPGADRCVGAKCVCGATGAPCPSGSACLQGACDANPCAGKPDGTGCDDKLYCTDPDACKSGVCTGPPRSCSASSSACNDGVCDEAKKSCGKPKVGGTPCGANGQCFAGSCCNGCWNGSSCLGGNAAAACGERGNLCQDCTSLECRSSPGTSCGAWWNPVCSTGGAKPDGTACAGGKCLDGACCSGCRDGSRCRAGTYPGYCGAGGAACVSCLSECRTGSTCANGACVDPLKPDGTGCSNGKCVAGTCCTGCISGKSCSSGGSTSACGTGGAPCKSCPPATGVCKKAVCTSGSCGIGNAADGTGCTGGSCVGGSCCTGCVGAGTCRAGNEDAFCGSAGGACADCAAQSLKCASGGCA